MVGLNTQTHIHTMALVSKDHQLLAMPSGLATSPKWRLLPAGCLSCRDAEREAPGSGYMHGNGGITLEDCLPIIQLDIESAMAASSHTTLYICTHCCIRLAMLEVTRCEDSAAATVRCA